MLRKLNNLKINQLIKKSWQKITKFQVKNLIKCLCNLIMITNNMRKWLLNFKKVKFLINIVICIKKRLSTIIKFKMKNINTKINNYKKKFMLFYKKNLIFLKNQKKKMSDTEK